MSLVRDRNASCYLCCSYYEGREAEQPRVRVWMPEAEHRVKSQLPVSGGV